MLETGPAQRVTIYIGERHHYRGRSAYMAVLDYLMHHQVAGATVTRGLAGFGPDHHIHTAEILAASGDLPIKIEFIDRAARIDELLPKLRDLVGDGMITVQPTEVVLAPRERSAPAPPPPAHVRLEGAAKLLRIYVGDKDRIDGRPLHELLVEMLRARDMAGVTVYRGIAGYGAGARPEHDLPVMLSVVDTEGKIRAFLPELDRLVVGGLVVLSDVEVVKYVHGGPRPPAGGGA